MDDLEDDTPLTRAARWFNATPFELVGLAVLLSGALVASVTLWWVATGRPDQLPASAGGFASEDVELEVGVHRGVDHEPEIGGAQSTPSGDAEASGSDGGTSDAIAQMPAQLTIHVTGEVQEPGLVVVPGGARVGDAVAAAGGLTGDAASELINLARPLTDGEHVHVLRPGEEPPSTSPPPAASPGGGDGAIASPGAGSLVNLNTASHEELQTLPGIGPAKAEAIVRHREQHGAFAVPGDVRAVRGIGEATFQGLADLVTVE